MSRARPSRQRRVQHCTDAKTGGAAAAGTRRAKVNNNVRPSCNRCTACTRRAGVTCRKRHAGGTRNRWRDEKILSIFKNGYRTSGFESTTFFRLTISRFKNLFTIFWFSCVSRQDDGAWSRRIIPVQRIRSDCRNERETFSSGPIFHDLVSHQSPLPTYIKTIIALPAQFRWCVCCCSYDFVRLFS